MNEPVTQINVVTINCWGLKYISKHRRERLKEIGCRLASANPVPHIVGLQECWTQEDYSAIRRETRKILKHGKYYHSGVFGGGLAILSKWPIEQSSMMQYPLNGRPTAFWRGDWYVGKGVASARIRIGSEPGQILQVFTTHLHAKYESDHLDTYRCHRIAQAWEISKLMRNAAESGNLVIGLGDFNMAPSSLEHQLITANSPMQDAWEFAHPTASPKCQVGQTVNDEEHIPTAEFNLYVNGVTSNSPFNTWDWNKAHQRRLGSNEPQRSVSGSTPDPEGVRLDYIFISRRLYSGQRGEWIVKDSRVGMIESHPTLQCSLSDHFAVEATIEWEACQPSMNTDTGNADSTTQHESGSIPCSVKDNGTPTKHQTRHTIESSVPPLPAECYDQILDVVKDYIAREKFQRRSRLYHFYGAIVVSVACLIAIWWSPHNFVSFILLFLSTTNLSAGVVNGLIGGLFMSSEIRALKEFLWEIGNAKQLAGGVGTI